jgi:hypothetical protein
VLPGVARHADGLTPVQLPKVPFEVRAALADARADSALARQYRLEAEAKLEALAKEPGQHDVTPIPDAGTPLDVQRRLGSPKRARPGKALPRLVELSSTSPLPLVRHQPRRQLLEVGAAQRPREQVR